MPISLSTRPSQVSCLFTPRRFKMSTDDLQAIYEECVTHLNESGFYSHLSSEFEREASQGLELKVMFVQRTFSAKVRYTDALEQRSPFELSA